MELTRRDTLAIGAGAVAAAALPTASFAAGHGAEALMAFTGGADIAMGGVTLEAPEIAENGNTVPVSVDAPGAVAIALFATGNPDPAVMTATFGELAGSQSLSTRIRLGGTQIVRAVAKMADGSFAEAKAEVKVTIGGCGG